ncbi:MAG: DUF1385 domain-containing protein [Solirubrobacteraceae bacterium]
MATTDGRAQTISAGGDQQLTAARDAPVGGQAVLEGVMMRGVAHWAVAVRKPVELVESGKAEALADPRSDVEPEGVGEIAVRSFPLRSRLGRHRAYRLPVVRGVVALAESLGIGLRALSFSANAQLPGGTAGEAGGQEISSAAWFGTVLVSVAFAIGLFFVVPVGLTSLIKHQLGSSVLFWLVEGVLRTSIFLAYLLLLSRVPDLRRVFQYHGAEHKVISCYEAGDELVPERAQRYSRLHPRCGTSFLLIVMIMAIFVFAPIGLPSWWILVLTRILGVPLIAGLSFEVIKWAGRNRSRRWVQTVMYPGLQLQKLTTREPDLDQLAVSITALNAVLALETPGDATAADLIGVEVVA